VPFYWNLHAPYDSTPQIIDQTALEYKLRIDPTRFFRNKASSKSHTLNNTKNHKTETRLLRILISCTMHSPMKFFRRCQRSSLMRWIDTRTKQHEITRSRRFSFPSNSSAKSGNFPSPHKPRPLQLRLPSDHRPRSEVGTHRRDGSEHSRARNGQSAASLLLRRRRSDVRSRRRRRSGGRAVRRTRPTVARFVCLFSALCVICPFASGLNSS